MFTVFAGASSPDIWLVATLTVQEVFTKRSNDGIEGQPYSGYEVVTFSSMNSCSSCIVLFQPLSFNVLLRRGCSQLLQEFADLQGK